MFMDDAMIFPTHKQYFDDIANPFKDLINVDWRCQPTYAKFSETSLIIWVLHSC